MSMKSADEPSELDLGDYIEFVMLDGTKRVPCRVSQEAIDDIEGGKPPSHERMERFNRHRARIEDICPAELRSRPTHALVTSKQLAGRKLV
jgi:hypothetical protein